MNTLGKSGGQQVTFSAAKPTLRPSRMRPLGDTDLLSLDDSINDPHTLHETFHLPSLFVVFTVPSLPLDGGHSPRLAIVPPIPPPSLVPRSIGYEYREFRFLDEPPAYLHQWH